MALTREALLGRRARGKPKFLPGLWTLGLLVPSLLAVACAEGIAGDDYEDYTTPDAAPVVHEPAPGPVGGGVVLAPYDAGAVVPNVPSTPVRDAGTVRDAGNAATPSDAGASISFDSSTAPTPVVDAGAPKPVDAGTDSAVQPQTDAGSNGQMCSATPAYATSSACAKCTCTKCASQVAACYASSDSAMNTQCAAVQACAETNHCTGDACYCGDALLCLNPAGPCKAPIESAAGSGAGALDVQRQAADTSTALGRAAAIGSCEQMNCKSECGL